MQSIQRPPWHQNVATGAPWLGDVALLQYNHGIPDMPVEKVYLNCRPRHHLPPTPLDGVVPWASVVGKAKLLVHGSPPGSVVPQYRLPPVAFLCCVCRWTASDPNALSPLTLNTVLLLAVSSGRITPCPSSTVCMPPPTECLLPDIDSRPFRRSSLR